MRDLPEHLTTGPFTRTQALAAGVSSRALQGKRFIRIHPRVWRHRDHVMTDDDQVTAAVMAMPDDAHLTGITRIQRLGLDYGPSSPIRFVVVGDLHLAVDGIFLHRTKKLPPLDGVGVTPEAGFLSYCAGARVIDAVKVGDWLLRNKHLTLASVRTLALAALWRPGADEALWILGHLDGRSRSLKESETRVLLTFSGLPQPESNLPIDLGDDPGVIGDLVYRPWGLVVEYEGRHHQEDREQYCSDLDRYALFRAHQVPYVQVTNERLAQPRILVGEVFRELVRLGYVGTPPEFGETWKMLFARVSQAVGPRSRRRAA
jgi:hypothetical protein